MRNWEMKCTAPKWEDHTNYDDFVPDPYPPLSNSDKDLRPVPCGGELVEVYGEGLKIFSSKGKDLVRFACEDCGTGYYFEKENE